MRISDWYSYVCSSDLQVTVATTHPYHHVLVRVARAAKISREAELRNLALVDLEERGRLEGAAPRGLRREVIVGAVDQHDLGRGDATEAAVVLSKIGRAHV